MAHQSVDELFQFLCFSPRPIEAGTFCPEMIIVDSSMGSWRKLESVALLSLSGFRHVCYECQRWKEFTDIFIRPRSTQTIICLLLQLDLGAVDELVFFNCYTSTLDGVLSFFWLDIAQQLRMVCRNYEDGKFNIQRVYGYNFICQALRLYRGEHQVNIVLWMPCRCVCSAWLGATLWRSRNPCRHCLTSYASIVPSY